MVWDEPFYNPKWLPTSICINIHSTGGATVAIYFPVLKLFWNLSFPTCIKTTKLRQPATYSNQYVLRLVSGSEHCRHIRALLSWSFRQGICHQCIDASLCKIRRHGLHIAWTIFFLKYLTYLQTPEIWKVCTMHIPHVPCCPPTPPPHA